MRRIALHVERLVVDGIVAEAGGSRLLGTAVEAELARLFERGSLAPSLRGGLVLPSLGAPGIRVPVGLGPVPLGHKIAGAVYRGIGS